MSRARSIPRLRRAGALPAARGGVEPAGPGRARGAPDSLGCVGRFLELGSSRRQDAALRGGLDRAGAEAARHPPRARAFRGHRGAHGLLDQAILRHRLFLHRPRERYFLRDRFSRAPGRLGEGSAPGRDGDRLLAGLAAREIPGSGAARSSAFTTAFTPANSRPRISPPSRPRSFPWGA